MKKLLIILFAMLTFGVSTHGLQAAESTFSVEQMDCVTCPIVVIAALKKLEGVESSQVSMELREVTVKYDDQVVLTDQIAKTISESGFPATLKQ